MKDQDAHNAYPDPAVHFFSADVLVNARL